MKILYIILFCALTFDALVALFNWWNVFISGTTIKKHNEVIGIIIMKGVLLFLSNLVVAFTNLGLFYIYLTLLILSFVLIFTKNYFLYSYGLITVLQVILVCLGYSVLLS